MLTVLFMYECLITGYEEVEFFWKARWTGATALFMANRYFSLGWYIYNIIGSLAVLQPQSRTPPLSLRCNKRTDLYFCLQRSEYHLTLCTGRLTITVSLQLRPLRPILPGHVRDPVPSMGR